MENKLKFIQNFVGRTDVYAIQDERGEYCPSNNKSKLQFLREHYLPVKVTRKVLEEHLDGEITIGTYVIDNHDNSCKFMIIDSDSKNKGDFKTIIDVSNRIGLSDLLMEFSGRKGYHFWYFFEKPISAEKARRLGRIIEDESGLDLEIFPKQKRVVKLGNLVKLPLGIHKVNGNRSYFVDEERREIGKPEINRISEATVDRLLDKYGHKFSIAGSKNRNRNVKQKYKHNKISTAIGDLRCYRKIMLGVPKGYRDDCLTRLVIKLCTQGISRQKCFNYLLNTWNSRNNPPKLDDKIVEKVQRFYSQSEPLPELGTSCADPILRKFCQSECKNYKKSYKARNLGDRETFLGCLRNVGKPVTYNQCKRALKWIFIPQYLVDDLCSKKRIAISFRNHELVFKLAAKTRKKEYARRRPA